jgi:hypothetical protein
MQKTKATYEVAGSIELPNSLSQIYYNTFQPLSKAIERLKPTLDNINETVLNSEALLPTLRLAKMPKLTFDDINGAYLNFESLQSPLQIIKIIRTLKLTFDKLNFEGFLKHSELFRILRQKNELWIKYQKVKEKVRKELMVEMEKSYFKVDDDTKHKAILRAFSSKKFNPILQVVGDKPLWYFNNYLNKCEHRVPKELIKVTYNYVKTIADRLKKEPKREENSDLGTLQSNMFEDFRAQNQEWTFFESIITEEEIHEYLYENMANDGKGGRLKLPTDVETAKHFDTSIGTVKRKKRKEREKIKEKITTYKKLNDVL